MKLNNIRLRTRKVVAMLGLATLAAAAVVSGAIAQQAPGDKPRAVFAEVRHVTAEVQDINYQTRMVTLKGPSGRTVSFRADPRVRNLDQVKQGDLVNATYYESTSIIVRSPEGGPSLSESKTVEVAPRGQKPGGVVTTTTTAVATVTDIDYQKRIAKLQGPDGKITTVHATAEVKRFNEVRKGDQVVVTVTDAIAVSLKK